MKLKSLFPILAILAACNPSNLPEVSTRAVAPSTTLPPMKVFQGTPATTTTRPNSEIMTDFLDLAFRMESGRSIPVMTRFNGPITVRATGQVPASLMPDLRSLVTRIRNEAAIDISVSNSPNASITVEAIKRKDLQRAVPQAACFVVPRVSSWAEYKSARRTKTIDWTTLNRREKASIFIPSDVSPQEVRDCLHEELAQALGPLNDLYRLPDSVFNDDNIHTVLTAFDMLILRMYYSADLSNGMTRGQAAAVLPSLLARMNPAGQRGGGRAIQDTPRDWITYMTTALAPGSSRNMRANSAAQAVDIAGALRWSGPRRGFTHYAQGRIQVGTDPDAALASFITARRFYGSDPLTQLHAAHVAVQLAAFTLSSGQAEQTLSLVDGYIPYAHRAQNAALLATLMMFRAEALELMGRDAEAQRVRLDSLGWARYGFGSEQNVRARLREVQNLSPTSKGLLNL